MREHKYRAWDKENQRMCQVLSLEYWDPEPGAEFVLGGCYLVPECRRFRKIEELELLQYTGLKDKNGTEIYEGDIVRVPGNYISYGTHNAAIEWSAQELGWTASGLKLRHSFPDAPTELEVLGNVYEHSALLPDKHKDD